MAITELPLGSGHLRSSWQNSFFMPANQTGYDALSVALGTVSANFGTFALCSPGNNSFGGTRAPISILAGGYASAITGFQQTYLTDDIVYEVGPDETINPSQTISVPSATTPFPANTIALAVLQMSPIGKIVQVTDQRPSYLTSIPNYGPSATEVISDPTRRVLLQQSFYVPRTTALSQLIPADVALPCSGFFLGAGSVSISGILITTPSTYFSSAKNKGGWAVNVAWGPQLVPNALNQAYVSAAGSIVVQQIPTSQSGTFPANTLALFEATVDAAGQIRNLVDWRTSYI